MERLGWGAKISKKEAIILAQKEFEKQGIIWDEPIYVELGWREWHITTNTHSIGGNAHIRVNKRTGAVSGIAVSPK